MFSKTIIFQSNNFSEKMILDIEFEGQILTLVKDVIMPIHKNTIISFQKDEASIIAKWVVEFLPS